MSVIMGGHLTMATIAVFDGQHDWQHAMRL